MSSEPLATETVGQDPADAAGPGTPPAGAARRRWLPWVLLVAVVLLVDVAALIAFPPSPKDAPGQPCDYPTCFIESTLEFPAPATVVNLDPNGSTPPAVGVYFQPAISSTLLTMWIVMVLVVVGAALMVRGAKLLPGRAQNVFEWFYEFLSEFGVGLAGPTARPYVPIFVGAFLLVLFDNWIGLVPPVGKVEFLRAPSSDLNVTIGMALVSFSIFQFEGFRRLGVRGYLGKFFPFYEFRNGLGAGGIAMFVGLIELMLEFIKPITLSMRLFGNIYGGEVALGVITSLTIAFFPVLLIALELMLNAIQALIFSVLTLVFIVLAIESHHEDEGHPAEGALDSAGVPPGLQPAH